MGTRKYHRKSNKRFRKTRSKRGGNTGQEEKDKNLLKAATKGDLNKVIEAFDAGADVDTQDDDGNTALILASNNGHIETVQLLIGYGANVEAKDNNGYTALQLARHYGSTEIVNMLTTAIETAQKVMKQQVGFNAIEMVLFTGFVVQ